MERFKETEKLPATANLPKIITYPSGLPAPQAITDSIFIENQSNLNATGSNQVHYRQMANFVQQQIIKGINRVKKKDRAISLGAGPCVDLPLVELAKSFGELDLVDLDLKSTMTAVASNNIPSSEPKKITIIQEDVSGDIVAALALAGLINEKAITQTSSEKMNTFLTYWLANLVASYDNTDPSKKPPFGPRMSTTQSNYDFVNSGLIVSQFLPCILKCAMSIFNLQIGKNDLPQYLHLLNQITNMQAKLHWQYIMKVTKQGSIIVITDTPYRQFGSIKHSFCDMGVYDRLADEADCTLIDKGNHDWKIEDPQNPSLIRVESKTYKRES